jgi:hypothetical protein
MNNFKQQQPYLALAIVIIITLAAYFSLADRC